MRDREITGKQFKDAIGRSGMDPDEAMGYLGLKRATYYTWRADGVPAKDVPRVAAKLSRWLHLESQPQAPLSTYSNLDLLSELTRRLAVVERLASAEEHPNGQQGNYSTENLDDGADASGTATIVGRGPSSALGGSNGSARAKDDR